MPKLATEELQTRLERLDDAQNKLTVSIQEIEQDIRHLKGGIKSKPFFYRSSFWSTFISLAALTLSSWIYWRSEEEQVIAQLQEFSNHADWYSLNGGHFLEVEFKLEIRNRGHRATTLAEYWIYTIEGQSEVLAQQPRQYLEDIKGNQITLPMNLSARVTKILKLRVSLPLGEEALAILEASPHANQKPVYFMTLHNYLAKEAGIDFFDKPSLLGQRKPLKKIKVHFRTTIGSFEASSDLHGG